MTEKENNEKQQETSQQEQQQQQKEGNQSTERKEKQSFSINLALIGGAVGVGVGLLSSQGTSKKALKTLTESEFFNTASEELKKAANEILTDQAQKGIRQFASSYLSNSQEETAFTNDSSQYEEIKEENKHLNERLERIEKMLGELTQAK